MNWPSLRGLCPRRIHNWRDCPLPDAGRHSEGLGWRFGFFFPNFRRWAFFFCVRRWMDSFMWNFSNCLIFLLWLKESKQICRDFLHTFSVSIQHLSAKNGGFPIRFAEKIGKLDPRYWCGWGTGSDHANLSVAHGALAFDFCSSTSFFRCSDGMEDHVRVFIDMNILLYIHEYVYTDTYLHMYTCVCQQPLVSIYKPHIKRYQFVKIKDLKWCSNQSWTLAIAADPESVRDALWGLRLPSNGS